MVHFVRLTVSSFAEFSKVSPFFCNILFYQTAGKSDLNSGWTSIHITAHCPVDKHEVGLQFWIENIKPTTNAAASTLPCYRSWTSDKNSYSKRTVKTTYIVRFIIFLIAYTVLWFLHLTSHSSNVSSILSESVFCNQVETKWRSSLKALAEGLSKKRLMWYNCSLHFVRLTVSSFAEFRQISLFFLFFFPKHITLSGKLHIRYNLRMNHKLHNCSSCEWQTRKGKNAEFEKLKPMLQNDKRNSFHWLVQRRRTRDEYSYLKMYRESNIHSSVYCFSNKIIRQVLRKRIKLSKANT